MSLKVGSILEGKITGISKFGAFVALPDGKSGMVHISEIAPSFVKEITDHIKQDQVVKVMVLGVDDKGRISLSIKKAMEGDNKTGGNGAGGNSNSGTKPKKSFEDMLSSYMKSSTEKMSDLKSTNEQSRRRGGGQNRSGR